MKKYIKYFQIFNFLLCFILFGCITEYEPTGIDEVADILVVEGLISDDESFITLSRSRYLSDASWGSSDSQYIYDARVYVECLEDDILLAAEPPIGWNYPHQTRPQTPQYVIKTGTLDPNKHYRLKIEIDEINFDGSFWGGAIMPTTTYEYQSDYSKPLKTPEIDSIFWIKRGRGQPVMIHIATHTPDNSVMYYHWSYKEDWEINTDMYLEGYPNICWNTSRNRNLLLGSSQNTVLGKLTEKILDISPYSVRLSVLYRIDIKQTAISKRAYDYFANIKKNSVLIGDIFAPVPSELRGNIICTTDPSRPVIGYIEVSTTTQKQKFISRRDNLFERTMICESYTFSELIDLVGEPPWYEYVLYDPFEPEFVHLRCVDCTYYNIGTLIKADDWPNTNPY